MDKTLQLLIDNRSTINLAKNPVSHGRGKHIETHFHFLREKVIKGKLEIVQCPTISQLVDVLAKALKADRFVFLRESLGIVPF